ncbi:hypothetical protein AAVH_25418, partial [Aphelenchoides avenae]
TYSRIDVFNRFKNARLLDAIQEKQVECDQLRDANDVLQKTIETMQERLRSVEEDFVQFREHASVRESELQSEVDSLRSTAEERAQHLLLLQEDYAQARDISRRKESALKEQLEEQCLISESLNAAVEEMQHLITMMIEANEERASGSLQAAIQDTAAHRDVAGEAPQAAFRPDVTVDRITSGLPANATAHDDNAIKRFVTAVYVTLFSEPHGYDSLPRLLHDLREDSGLEGEALARELGYESFEAFLHSPEMAPRIVLGALPDGRQCYKVYPTKCELEHYVAQQLGTDYGDTRRALARQREENNKLRRQLASTMERVEKLRGEAAKPKPVLDTNTEFQRRIDELEKMVNCGICMSRPKDIAFACGHTCCNECSVRHKHCTLRCQDQNGKPLTSKYRIFL